jgi:hypothetical protein
MPEAEFWPQNVTESEDYATFPQSCGSIGIVITKEFKGFRTFMPPDSRRGLNE